MRTRAFLLIILILVASFLVVSSAAPGDDIVGYIPYTAPMGISHLVPLGEECIVCELFENVPDSGLMVFMDDVFYTIDMVVYYENTTASPPRQPIDDALMVVYIYNDTGVSNGLWRVFTDERGEATFDFTPWAGAKANFKILYCPFCCPGEGYDEWCGWEECLAMAEIPGPATPDLVPILSGHSAPSELNCGVYKPSLQVLEYNPPPDEPTAGVPVLCSIGLLIFSLLGGALYMSGRNPFGGFSLAAPRMGRHIRYQARSRGWALDTMAIASSIRSGVRQGKQIKKGRKSGKSRGTVFKEIAKRGSPIARFRRLGKAMRGRMRGGGGTRTEVGPDGTVRVVGGERAGEGKDRRVIDVMRQQTRESRAYLKGGRLPGGRVETMDRGERAGAYGRFLLKSLGQLALGLFDRSSIGYVLSLNLESRLNEYLRGTERESRAVAIAAYEHSLDLVGRGDECTVEVRGDMALDANGDPIEGSGKVTVPGVGECTVIRTTITIGNEPTEVRILVRQGDEASVRRALASGNLADVNCLLEVPVAGQPDQVTRYDIRDGTLQEVHRVFQQRDDEGNVTGETTMIYRGDAPRDAPITFWTSESQLELVGAIVDGDRYEAVAAAGDQVDFYRVDARGERSALPSFNAGGGAVSMLEGPAAAAVITGMGMSGNTMEEMQMTAFSDRNRAGTPDLMDQVRATLDSRTSLVTEQYNEQLGQVESVRRSLFYDGLEGDDLTLRVVDSTAVLEGESRERALANGTEIHISGGRITGVSDSDGNRLEGATVADGRLTSFTGADGESVDIGLSGRSLLERDRSILPAMAHLGQAIGHYAEVIGESRAEQLQEQYHPDQLSAVDEYARILAAAPEQATPEPEPTPRQEPTPGKPEAPTQPPRAPTEFQREVHLQTREILEQTPNSEVGTPEQTARAQARALARTQPEMDRRARFEAAADVLGYRTEELTPETTAAVVELQRLREAAPPEERDSITLADAQQAVSERVEALAETGGVSREQAWNSAMEQYQESFIDLAEGHHAFEPVYMERAAAMASEIPAEDRASYLRAVSTEERRIATTAYEQTATRLFQEEHEGNPLSRLGVRELARMDETEARAGLEALGYEPREARRFMRDFDEIQGSARELVVAAKEAAYRAPSMGNQIGSASRALLSFVPPAEALTTALPREPRESEEEYGRRVEEFRRDTASAMAAALARDGRTDTAAKLGTDEGRRAALVVCNEVLVNQLDAAVDYSRARVEGRPETDTPVPTPEPRIEGFQRQRYYAEEARLFERLQQTAEAYISTGRMERTVRDPESPLRFSVQRGNIFVDYTAFIATTQISAAAQMPTPERVDEKGRTRRPTDGGYTRMPNSIYSVATDAIEQYNSGNLIGMETPPTPREGEERRELTHAEQEGAARLFMEAAIRADQYVDSQDRGPGRARVEREKLLADIAPPGELRLEDVPPPPEPTTPEAKARVEKTRVAREKTKEIMADLEKATHDEEVATAARRPPPRRPPTKAPTPPPTTPPAKRAERPRPKAKEKRRRKRGRPGDEDDDEES